MDDFWCLLLLGNCCLPDGEDIEEHNSSGDRKKRSNHRVVPLSSSKAEDEQRLLPKDNGNDHDLHRSVTHKPSWNDLDCLSYLLLGSADETDGIDGRTTTIPAVVQVETTDDGDCRDSISDIQEIRHCSVKLAKSHSQGTETNKRNSALSQAVDLWISDAYPQVKEEATILSGRSKSTRSAQGSFSLTLPERSSTGDTDNGTTIIKSSSKTTTSISKSTKRRRNCKKSTHRMEDNAAVATEAMVRTTSTGCRSEPKYRTLSTQHEASKVTASPYQPERSTSFTTVSSKQHVVPREISISSTKDSIEDVVPKSAPPAIVIIMNTSDKKKSKKKRKKKRPKGASSSSAASSMASSFASSCASKSKRSTSTKILSITADDGDWINKENVGIALPSETSNQHQRIPLTIQTKRQVLYSHV